MLSYHLDWIWIPVPLKGVLGAGWVRKEQRVGHLHAQ